QNHRTKERSREGIHLESDRARGNHCGLGVHPAIDADVLERCVFGETQRSAVTATGLADGHRRPGGARPPAWGVPLQDGSAASQGSAGARAGRAGYDCGNDRCEDPPMNEDKFNMSLRKFLKQVGVTSQREIERIVRDKGMDRGTLKVKIVLTADGTNLNHVVEEELDLG